MQVRPRKPLTWLLAAVGALACGASDDASVAPAPERAMRAPEYVGGAACASCHPTQAERWQGSHHDRAMQVATDETVLGDFGAAEVTHFGVTSTFSKRGGRYVVRTDGADGEMDDYPVAYTFGVDPLQQYLVRFPDGRVQALPLAWDTRPRGQGGQRWLHLYPDEPIPHGDLLHWTGLQQNWNHMCAACHSTRLRKGYDAAADRFDTTWSEIDVSCEACHGPGSRHEAWARAVEQGERSDPPPDLGLANPLRAPGAWQVEAGTPIARRSQPLASRAQIETCGRCHSRASLLREAPAAGQPLLDTHRVALLDPPLYFVDGQIRDEVYVYGSFRQSRMYAAGVRCSDCHDPHSLAIQAPVDGVCSRCHVPEVYATRAHHHHPPASVGASCVGCHMPARTYMGVDDRHDHGFRVPRPDLSAALGSPDACTACHADRSADWAAAQLGGWRGGEKAGAHHGQAFHAAQERKAGAARRLTRLAADAEHPAIVRATALRALGPVLDGESVPALESGLRDPDPLVRMAALGSLEALAPPARLPLAQPRLRDPVLAVRLEAERVLRPVPAGLWRPQDRAALAEVQAESLEIQRLHADRPESWANLGLLYAGRAQPDEARAAYERALRIEPRFVPAAVNLADLHRASGRDDESERVLRDALARDAENADVHHALGLTLVRLGRRGEATVHLARAAELAPDRPRYAYVHAVALHSAGDSGGARRVVDALLERYPADPAGLALRDQLQGSPGRDRFGAQ